VPKILVIFLGIKCHGNPLGGSRVATCGQADVINLYAHFCDLSGERAKIVIKSSIFIEDLLLSNISRHYVKWLMET
jgi:hypothetical protein